MKIDRKSTEKMQNHFVRKNREGRSKLLSGNIIFPNYRTHGNIKRTYYSNLVPHKKHLKVCVIMKTTGGHQLRAPSVSADMVVSKLGFRASESSWDMLAL